MIDLLLDKFIKTNKNFIIQFFNTCVENPNFIICEEIFNDIVDRILYRVEKGEIHPLTLRSSLRRAINYNKYWTKHSHEEKFLKTTPENYAKYLFDAISNSNYKKVKKIYFEEIMKE